MSSPKLQRILDALAARVAVIAQADGFYTDVGCRVLLDRREPTLDDLPCVLVYLSERVALDVQNKRARTNQTLTVAGYRRADDPAEQIGIELLADLQRAAELEDSTLGGLLDSSQYGMTFQSDEIYMPDIGEGVVGARITYAIPHIRRSGDPEIA